MMKLAPKPWSYPTTRAYLKSSAYGQPGRVRRASARQVNKCAKQAYEVLEKSTKARSRLAATLAREYLSDMIADAERRAGWTIDGAWR